MAPFHFSAPNPVAESRLGRTGNEDSLAGMPLDHRRHGTPNWVVIFG
jgi:hypothetical protein